MKLVITGGCGFIGSNLVRELDGKGYDIIVYDNLSKGNPRNIEGTSVRLIEGDIRDSKSILSACEGADKLIHLAAAGNVVESVVSPEDNFDINVRGTFEVLNAARNSSIKKVIFASTGGALMGNAKPPVDELSLPKPISPYGSSKLCGEAYCSSFASTYSMDIIALRFANIVGPYSAHKVGAVTKFIEAVKADTKIELFGDGSSTRDYLYVGDLCEGIAKALNKDLKGFTPIHMASGVETSITDLAQTLVHVSGRTKFPIVHSAERPGEVKSTYAKNMLAKQLLEFEPKINLEEALRETWKWFESN